MKNAQTNFIYLLTIHTALLVASNAGGAKMIALPFGLAASATVFSYMATFVILDIISEVYGKEKAKITINVGLMALVLSVTFFTISILAPSAVFWNGQQSYVETLGSSWRILLGGWVSYLVSQNLDVWSFFKLKESRFGNSLFVRAVGSTAIGQILDTVIFMTIAFYGVFPLLPAIIGQYLIKVVLTLAMLPVLYILVPWARKRTDSVL